MLTRFMSTPLGRPLGDDRDALPSIQPFAIMDGRDAIFDRNHRPAASNQNSIWGSTIGWNGLELIHASLLSV
jgi:hypothetical protein